MRRQIPEPTGSLGDYCQLDEVAGHQGRVHMASPVDWMRHHAVRPDAGTLWETGTGAQRLTYEGHRGVTQRR